MRDIEQVILERSQPHITSLANCRFCERGGEINISWTNCLHYGPGPSAEYYAWRANMGEKCGDDAEKNILSAFFEDVIKSHIDEFFLTENNLDKHLCLVSSRHSTYDGAEVDTWRITDNEERVEVIPVFPYHHDVGDYDSLLQHSYEVLDYIYSKKNSTLSLEVVVYTGSMLTTNMALNDAINYFCSEYKPNWFFWNLIYDKEYMETIKEKQEIEYMQNSENEEIESVKIKSHHLRPSTTQFWLDQIDYKK